MTPNRAKVTPSAYVLVSGSLPQIQCEVENRIYGIINFILHTVLQYLRIYVYVFLIYIYMISMFYN